MQKDLNVLIIEDTSSDADLIIRLLKKAGYVPNASQVETEAEMLAALQAQNWDIVISDFSLPSFNGLAALQLLQRTNSDIPFIAVSGTIGEETAVTMMKAGAHDYVMKDNLARLVPAVERELEQAHVRRERNQAERALRQSEDRYRQIVTTAREGILLTDQNLNITFVNPQAEAMFGYAPGEMIGIHLQNLAAAEDQADNDLKISRRRQGISETYEGRLTRKDGSQFWALVSASPVLDENGVYLGSCGMCTDISERKQRELELQHHRDDLELINALNEIVNRGGSYENLVETLSRQARRLVSARECTLYLLSADEQYLIMQNLMLPTELTTTIERFIGRPIPKVQIPLQSGSFFDHLLKSEQGLIISEPGEIQAWMQEFSETVYLPPSLRAAVRAIIPQIYRLLDMRSIITVPLHSNGKVVGLLDLSSAGLFSQEDLSRIRNISGQVTAAIMRKRDEQALRASERKYQVLAEAAPVGIYRTDINGLTTYVNPRWSQISGLTSEASLGLGWMQAIEPEDKERLMASWDAALRSRKPSVIEYRFLRPDGSIAWVLDQTTPEKDYDNRVLGYVGTVTDITERKQTQVQIETQLRRLGALHEIDSAITASFDLNLILEVLIKQATDQLGVDAASVLLLNREHQALQFAAGRGFNTPHPTSAFIPLGHGMAGRVALERRLVQAVDVEQIRAKAAVPGFFAEEAFAAYYGAPLIAKDQVIGVLEVFHRQPYQADPAWLEFFTTLAEQAAIAIDNARLFDNLERSNQELSQAYDATIEGWSRALDLRDKETEGHTQRVTETTMRLAQAMGISETDLVHIRRGALLHDIGKMGVPDAILFKPGQLDEAEWQIMRQHPQFAYDMLAPITYLRPALDIPYCHHEKWDGSGYPNRLSGEQIPLAARLFAVVDVWDALLSDRPYRRGWPPDKVLDHIRSLSGQHFDPQAVALFLKLVG